jgi:hypothetical protein
MFLSRRKFCGSIFCFIVSAQGSSASGDLHTSCNLSFDAAGNSIDKATIRKLSFKTDDYANALVQVLDDLSRHLGISFDFGLYEDGSKPNAAFSSDPSIRPASWTSAVAPDGIILLGVSLIAELRNLYGDLSAPLTALCAHEAGHSLQRKYKLDSWRSYSIGDDDERFQDRYELCADFISGFYGARRQKADSSYPAAIQAVTQFSKGERRPIGHGTPQQRGNAVAAGYQLGRTDGIGQTGGGSRVRVRPKRTILNAKIASWVIIHLNANPLAQPLTKPPMIGGHRL